MKRPTLQIAIALVLLSAVAGGGYVAWRSHQSSEALKSSAPARPEMADRPAEFRNRVADCEETLAKGPDRLAALKELSGLYHANGFYPEAGECYQTLMQVEADEPRWPHRLADILAGYGQLEDAVPLWERTVELQPRYVPAGIRLGDALLKLNRFEEAEKAYLRVLSISPDNPYALVGLARADVKAERWRQAQERLEKAAQTSGQTIGSDLLVTVYEKQGRQEQAEILRGRVKASGTFFDPPDEWLNEVYEDCYDPYRLSLVAGSIQRAGDAANGLRLLQRAGSLSPNSAPIQYQLGLMYVAMSDGRGALRAFQKVVEMDPTFSDGWVQLIEVFKRMGQTEGAERALAAGLAHCPKSPALHLERGRRLAAAGRRDEAITHFERTVELRPEEAEPYVELAKLYFQREELQRSCIAR